jgi:hypothetical protein
VHAKYCWTPNSSARTATKSGKSEGFKGDAQASTGSTPYVFDMFSEFMSHARRRSGKKRRISAVFSSWLKLQGGRIGRRPQGLRTPLGIRSLEASGTPWKPSDDSSFKEPDKATELLRGERLGTYLLEQVEGRVLLLRISEGEPDDTAFAPASLWPGLLPVACSSPA